VTEVLCSLIAGCVRVGYDAQPVDAGTDVGGGGTTGTTAGGGAPSGGASAGGQTTSGGASALPPGIPTVVTGIATDIDQSHARLGVTVTDEGASALIECGVCWAPVGTNIIFVTQLGPEGIRCMRQIPCLNNAYFTNDGYMDQREYTPGATYAYRAYATNGNGTGYGSLKTFGVPG
jgi:hypothetical protein